MSQQPKTSNTYTLAFVVILCFSCAMILSTLASFLKEPQEQAEQTERSTQMLMAAGIFDPVNKTFVMTNDQGEEVPAKVGPDGLLVEGTKDDVATQDEILKVYAQRIEPFLVDSQGNRTSFKEAGINLKEYIDANWKDGFADLPLKLVYEIRPNTANEDASAIGYIFPVSGFGLWDAIAGYIAVADDGYTVKGIAWYSHKETPGLGAEITEPEWQKQFEGKKIFTPTEAGKEPNLKAAPIGITVLKGTVQDTYSSDSPKAESAVDGMAGATLTGVGVTKAYKDSLSPYRPFLINVNKSNQG